MRVVYVSQGRRGLLLPFTLLGVLTTLRSGPGCENDPYDNQKDAKLGDGSGKHDNSIGSWRCGWKDFGYDRVSNDG